VFPPNGKNLIYLILHILATPYDKALLTAGTLFIDFMYFEENPSNHTDKHGGGTVNVW